MVGLVHNSAICGGLYHPRQTERATSDILREVLDSFLISGRKEDIAMNAEHTRVEAGVTPCPHLLDDVLGDSAFIQKETEDLVLP